MRTRNAFLATAALLASVALAAPAFAAAPIPVLSSFGAPNALMSGEQLIADFNDPSHATATLLPGFSLTFNGATVGFNEGVSGYSGTLFGDSTHYLTIPGSASATLTSDNLLSSFSFYMGSPDEYNSIRFIGAGYDYTVPGTALVLGDTNQSWSWGKRVNFDFGGAKVNQIILSSTGNSFEVDSFAARVAGVPEPASWAMMLMGFGAIGAAMRRRRPAVAFA